MTFNERGLPMEDDLQLKTTSNGRQPQNIKSGIYQQSLIGSYSNLKLKLREPKLQFSIQFWGSFNFGGHSFLGVENSLGSLVIVGKTIVGGKKIKKLRTSIVGIINFVWPFNFGGHPFSGFESQHFFQFNNCLGLTFCNF
jgi:hypothetical protein